MSVELLRQYKGNWNRELEKSQGFYDFVWETGPKGRRIKRVRAKHNVAQSMELRLSLWRTAWFADREHGVFYSYHLGANWPDHRDAFVMDLISQTFKDKRITQWLAMPEPEMDAKSGHLSAVVHAACLRDEEIEALANSAVGFPG